jgi:hypothetical protein
MYVQVARASLNESVGHAEGNRRMTQTARFHAVESIAADDLAASSRHAVHHQELALSVYGRLFERFGALPGVLLSQLAKATVAELTTLVAALAQHETFEALCASVGWAIPHGGEGNYCLDWDHDAARLPVDARREFEVRLDALRQAQEQHARGSAAWLLPHVVAQRPDLRRVRRHEGTELPPESLSLIMSASF